MIQTELKLTHYLILISNENKLLFNDSYQLMKVEQLQLNMELTAVLVGEVDNKPVYLHAKLVDSSEVQPATAMWCDLREALGHCERKLFEVVSRASQYIHFINTHRFCGKCAHPLTLSNKEFCVECQQCHYIQYPKISPCVIVAIKHQDKLLLAQGTHSRSKWYSCIAGFVESGESLEQAVAREVMEEVGIELASIDYVKSQAWPFPHQLMAGFIAEAKTTTITMDPDEIADAKWFSLDQLPEYPPTISISGQLIELQIERIRKLS